ncbi:uncharacterized protein LDX57_002162 [Aspergillus melleus]|uniref:uncharacterized protein n=1 Tax=Aspergillus melleus TaxID=138277 RepID=UPI001E8DE178|nr:uncharacterized protein LDX57_002162 [Aspergillus melleus]KAH8424411.1 hypothetical protein LDX57_002162 [Aspergillus melleus]
MSSSIHSMFMPFKVTLNDLDRQMKLEAQGFEFEGGCPFTINLYGYINEATICSGIEHIRKELSRQLFVACMEPRPSKTSLARRNKDTYYRVKVTFNIATAPLSPKPEPDDAQVITTAIIWHLGSSRDLELVNNAYEKRGKCRGQDIVVLRVKVVPEGVKDCVYFYPRDPAIDADLESVGETEFVDALSDEGEIDGWVFL